jgi:diguanylate cyclase (GGDEF)-like protein/PAS domain S-box-containing protein
LLGVLLRNLVIAALALSAGWFGALQPLDRWLQDSRFALLRHTMDGGIATVEIDESSLRSIGEWPWSRALHALLLDKLLAMGAKRVVFDIDFGSPTNALADERLEGALRRANGRAFIAVFRPSAGGDKAISQNRPFADAAPRVAADAPAEPNGETREYWTARRFGESIAPTLGALLADRRDSVPKPFGIDFSLDMSGIARLSAADVIAGAVDPAKIAGKDIIVGASAPELGDSVVTPRLGAIPGALLHALAAETLRRGRALADWPFAFAFSLTLWLAALAAILNDRLARPSSLACIVAAIFGVEVVAIFAQDRFDFRAATAAPQVSFAVSLLIGLLFDLVVKRRLRVQGAREREDTRSILTRVVQDNSDGVIVVDDAGRVLVASRFATELLGNTLVGGEIDTLLPPALASALAEALSDHRNQRPASRAPRETAFAGCGGTRILEYVITVSTLAANRQTAAACLTFRDISDRRGQERRLAYLAQHDELTGVWTRGQFCAELGRSLSEGLGAAQGFSVFCLDLRRFILVNDIFGRAVGDALLRAVADRLRSLGHAWIARLGGDSFVFARPGEPCAEALETLGRSFVATICLPYEIEGHKLIIGASLGAATTATSGRDPETLISHASMAQDSAKRAIGDVFARFSPDMERLRREKQGIDERLRRAITDGSLSLHYQPKIDLATGRVVGAEALLRWRDETGAIPPAKFIPIAEESGFIVELGRWALRRACDEAVWWPSEVSVAVNVSPVQLSLTDLREEAFQALANSGLSARRLEIEITESVFVEREAEVSRALEALRELGLTVALDDFGTGYSSLHYLGRLPIDVIKIDQSFVRRLEDDPSAVATVEAIVALARAHGKALVAEGVSTAHQAERLTALGCEYGQGYLYARPLEGKAFRAFLAETRKSDLDHWRRRVV